MNKAQKQGEGQAAVAEEKAKVAQDDGIGEVKSERDLLAFFDKNPKYRQEYFEAIAAGKEQEWIQSHLNKNKAPEGETPEETPPEETPAEKPAEEPKAEETPKEEKPKEEKPKEKEVDIAAILAEKDKYAKDLQILENETLPELTATLETEKAQRASLEKRILELEKSSKEQGIRVEKTSKLPKIEIPVFDEDEDLLPASAQKKLRKLAEAASSLQKQNETLEARIEDLQGNLQNVSTQVVETKTKVEVERFSTQKSKEEADEYADVDALRQSHQEYFGEFKRPTEEIERDYISFLKEVAAKAEVSGSIYAKDGQIRSEVMQAARLFGEDTDEGKKLKEKCRLGYPEDFDVLEKVYNVRGVRLRFQEVDPAGKAKPLEYNAAYSIHVNSNPKIIQEIAAKAELKAHEAHERAVAKRASAAKETPPNAGASNFDASKFTDEEGNKWLNMKPSERPEDTKASLEQWMIWKGMPKEEAHAYAYGMQKE